VFEVGKYYKVKMWEDGPDGGLITEYGAAKVIEVQPPLIKLKSSAFVGGGEVILNTASLAFVSAEIAGE
jgi:hypothetical protein